MLLLSLPSLKITLYFYIYIHIYISFFLILGPPQVIFFLAWFHKEIKVFVIMLCTCVCMVSACVWLCMIPSPLTPDSVAYFLLDLIKRDVSKMLTASRKKWVVKIMKGLAFTTHSEGRLILVSFALHYSEICTS